MSSLDLEPEQDGEWVERHVLDSSDELAWAGLPVRFLLLTSKLVDISLSPPAVYQFLRPTDSVPPGVPYDDVRGFGMDAMTPDASLLVGGIQTNDTVRFPELACVVRVSASPGYFADMQTLLVQDLISSPILTSRACN